MAGKILKKYMKGSKNHKQQVGLRRVADETRNRTRNIDDIVDSAQTGKKPKD